MSKGTSKGTSKGMTAAPEQYWFKCPGCGYLAGVDKDQAEGLVSLDCPQCSFHETGKITPLISVYTSVNRKEFTSALE